MEKKKKIKVGLLNLQSGIGTTQGYWQYLFHLPKFFLPHNSNKISKTARVVKQEKIDIFATAEIEQGSKRTRYVDQVELLSEKSGLLNYNFFSALKWRNKINQGNAIHSRFKIIDSQNYRLPGAGEPRYLGKSRIQIGSRKIVFFVTHLSLNLTHRKAQLEKLSQYINKENYPVVLAGDFNICHEGELELLEKSKLQKVYTVKTYPVWNPKRRLDYIFASSDIKLEKGNVITEPLSDHCMLTVVLGL